MADEIVRYALRDGVAVLDFDDGKANAFSPAALDELNGQLDRAESEAGAVLWRGRPGRFSAGFDLSVMKAGGPAVGALVGAGAELFLRILDFPRPVVVACTGHAIAAGAIALLVADERVGSAGDFKIGLNEVAIGMTLPRFGVEMARHRLSKRHFVAATTQARLYSPEEARAAGYLDAVVEAGALSDAAFARARELAEFGDAFGGTKQRVNAPVIAASRAGLEAELGGMRGPS